MPLFERCLHINICVRDLDRTLRFYKKLGFEERLGPIVVEDTNYAKSIGMPNLKKARIAFLALSDDPYSPMLDFAQFVDPATQGDPYPNLIHTGICRIAYATKDIEETFRAVVEMGAECVTSIVDMPVDGGLAQRVLMFKDPDGIILEAVQLMDTPFNALWERPRA